MTFFIDLNKITIENNIAIITDNNIIHELEIASSFYTDIKTLEFNEYGQPINYYEDITFKFNLSHDIIEKIQLYIYNNYDAHNDTIPPVIRNLRELRDNTPLEFQEDLNNIEVLTNDYEIYYFYLRNVFDNELSDEALESLVHSNVLDVNTCLDLIENKYAVYADTKNVFVFNSY